MEELAKVRQELEAAKTALTKVRQELDERTKALHRKTSKVCALETDLRDLKAGNPAACPTPLLVIDETVPRPRFDFDAAAQAITSMIAWVERHPGQKAPAIVREFTDWMARVQKAVAPADQDDARRGTRPRVIEVSEIMRELGETRAALHGKESRVAALEIALKAAAGKSCPMPAPDPTKFLVSKPTFDFPAGVRAITSITERAVQQYGDPPDYVTGLVAWLSETQGAASVQ